MTPEQRLLFCGLLKNAKLNNITITVDDVVKKLGITKEEVKRPWHSIFKVSLAFEHNFKWILHAQKYNED